MKIRNFRQEYRDLELAHGYDLYNSEVLDELLSAAIDEYEKLVKWCISVYPEGVHFDNQPEDWWIDPFTNEPYPHVPKEYIEKASKK